MVKTANSRWSKSHELYNYIVFGILTTAINFFTYFLLTNWAALDFKIATTLAWFVSVLFAFLTNKLFVFHSRRIDAVTIVKELSSFLLSRVLSYGLDILTMVFLIQVLLVNDLVAKAVVNILVIIFNYIAGKFFVFTLAGRE